MWHALYWLRMFLDLPWCFILWSRVLVIMLHDSYLSGRLMFIIYMSHHACTVLLYMIYLLDYSCYYYYFQPSILPNILFLCPTYCYYIFIFSLLLFFSLRVLCWSASDGPLYYFSVFRSGSWYWELFVDHILVSLFSGEFSFLLDLSYSDIVDDIVYDSYVILSCAWLYVHICVLSYLLLTA